MSPAKPKRPVYGKPEPRNWWKLVGLWVCVLAGLAIIGWLFSVAKPMKPLTCDRNNVSLIEWGTCHE